MGKGGLALSSLVMAIPAGLLFYLSLMSVMRMGEVMPTLVMAITWTLMALSLLLAISPIIFLIAGPKAAVAAPGHTAAALNDLDASGVQDSRNKPTKQKSDDDDDEFAADDDNDGGADDEQLFDTSNDEAGAEEFEDNFDFDDDEAVEEEEEPAPKKKKKK